VGLHECDAQYRAKRIERSHLREIPRAEIEYGMHGPRECEQRERAESMDREHSSEKAVSAFGHDEQR